MTRLTVIALLFLVALQPQWLTAPAAAQAEGDLSKYHGMSIYYGSNVFAVDSDGDAQLEPDDADMFWAAEQEAMTDILDQLQGLGVDSVSIALPIYTDAWPSTRIFPGEYTPTTDQLEFFADQAHARDMTFVLKPLLDEQVFRETGNDAYWRGTVEPPDADEWFTTYTTTLHGIVDPIADKVDWLVIGTEFIALEAPAYEANWSTMINTLQATAPRVQLTYDQNWWDPSYILPFTPEWIGKLDALSISGYFPAFNLTDDATTAEIRQKLEFWTEEINRHIERFDIPLFFNEVGIAPETGALDQPYSIRGVARDYELQARYIAAACDYYLDISDGVWLWGTILFHADEPAEETVSFELLNVPAEAAVADCYAD